MKHLIKLRKLTELAFRIESAVGANTRYIDVHSSGEGRRHWGIPFRSNDTVEATPDGNQDRKLLRE